MSEDTEVHDEHAEAPKQGKKMLIIAMTIGISVGALAGSLVVGPLLADESGGDHAAEECADAVGGHGGLPEAPLAVHSLDNVVINPAQSGGTRFLMVSVGFGLKDAHAAESIALRDAELRDIVIRTLGSKTVDQLSDMAGRDGLKNEIRVQATALLGEEALLNVYFPQFVIQ